MVYLDAVSVALKDGIRAKRFIADEIVVAVAAVAIDQRNRLYWPYDHAGLILATALALLDDLSCLASYLKALAGVTYHTTLLRF